jgi:probable addiction module antidote protein
MKRKHRNYKESLFESLKDTQEALAYLNAALQDEDPRIFLIALKNVLTAQEIDISAFAQETNITRQNIYRILSSKGNPRWESLTSLLNALGLQIQLSEKARKVEPIAIDKKLLKILSKQASKQGISLDALIYEKLSK